MQHQSRKLEFWFHLGVGILTLAVMIGMAAFISSQVEKGMFPWWVYLLFAVYTIVILAIDHALFCRNLPED